MWSELILVALHVGGAPACEGDAEPVLAHHRATGADGCIGKGEERRLTLAPGGWVEQRVGDEVVLCANAGAEPRELVLRATLPPAVEPALACEDVEGGRRCAPTGGGVEELVCHVRALPTPRSEPAAAQQDERASGAQSLFVVEFGATDVTPAEARVLTRVMTAELGRFTELELSSGEQVRALLAEEAARQEAGCTEEASCLAEAARALGARWLVTGTVARVGRATRVEVALLDTRTGEVVQRESVDGEDALGAARRLPAVAHNLARPIRGGELRAIAPARFGRRMADAGAVWGSVCTGVATGGALLACSALPAVGCGAVLFPCVAASIAFPFTPFSFCLVSPPLWLAPVVGCGAAGLGALASDWWFDTELGWLRAGTAAGIAGLLTAGALLTLGSFGELALASTAASNLPVDQQTALGVGLTGAAIGATIVGAAVVAGVAYDFGIGLYGDEPVRVTSPPEREPPPRVATGGVLY